MVEIGTSKGYFGRRRIYSTSNVITPENVVDEVNKALNIHLANMREEEFLYWYRRGIQPILEREKEIRPEICNKVVINNADMIATFKNGYFLTKPATYVSRKDDDTITSKVNQLNEYVYLSGKYEADNVAVDWFHTTGLGVLYVKPNDNPDVPFKTYALDPRNAFTVYSYEPGNEPVMGVNMVIRDNALFIDAITKDYFYRIQGGELSESDLRFGINQIDTSKNSLVGKEPNIIGEIPIVEYTYNKLRMGAFENCLSIMDEINNIVSNQADGIEQFIQSLMVLYNCELDEGTTANSIRQMGFIALKNSGENKASLDIISQQLDQTQTQTTLNNLYEQMLDKAGVPSSVRDSGSTSDNVGSVYLRNGWATADTCARNTEDEFKASNAYYDRIILAILKRKIGFELNRSDFELKIVRNDLNNLLVKTQAAMNMKELGFAPALAFERSGLSNDPLTDVEISREYITAKWGTATPEGMNPENPEEGTENSQGNTEGYYIRGYWRNKKGQGATPVAEQDYDKSESGDANAPEK